MWSVSWSIELFVLDVESAFEEELVAVVLLAEPLVAVPFVDVLPVASPEPSLSSPPESSLEPVDLLLCDVSKSPPPIVIF